MQQLTNISHLLDPEQQIHRSGTERQMANSLTDHAPHAVQAVSKM